MTINATAAILDQYGEAVTTLGYRIRSFLLDLLPDITEQPDIPANIIGYGYGTGYKNIICTIIPSGKGIKLGLPYGATLPDPDCLLQGSGKVHKYIPLQTIADFDNKAVQQLLQEAQKARETEKTA